MGKLIVVDGDAVQGTDKHNVSGTGTISGPPGTACISAKQMRDTSRTSGMTASERRMKKRIIPIT